MLSLYSSTGIKERKGTLDDPARGSIIPFFMVDRAELQLILIKIIKHIISAGKRGERVVVVLFSILRIELYFAWKLCRLWLLYPITLI